MSIFRIQKNKENPYVIINKEMLENPNLSLKLKGFLAYCLSKPDNWKFHVRHLASVLKEGKDAIYAIIDEGIEFGYIERSKQVVKGKFESVDYIIHESPIQKIITVSAFPDTENPDTENPPLINNDNIVSKEEREEAAPSHPPKINNFVYKRVVIEMAKYKNLCDEFGTGIIQAFMDRLDEYADINPKRFKQYACHAAVIRKWIREDKEKQPNHKHQSSKEWIEKLRNRVTNNLSLTVTDEVFAYHAGQSYHVIKYTDHGYQEQIKNRLRKMNISVDGL